MTRYKSNWKKIIEFESRKEELDAKVRISESRSHKSVALEFGRGPLKIQLISSDNIFEILKQLEDTDYQEIYEWTNELKVEVKEAVADHL